MPYFSLSAWEETLVRMIAPQPAAVTTGRYRDVGRGLIFLVCARGSLRRDALTTNRFPAT